MMCKGYGIHQRNTSSWVLEYIKVQGILNQIYGMFNGQFCLYHHASCFMNPFALQSLECAKIFAAHNALSYWMDEYRVNKDDSRDYSLNALRSLAL